LIGSKPLKTGRWIVKTGWPVSAHSSRTIDQEIALPTAGFKVQLM
jgi:hypothetical protein